MICPVGSVQAVLGSWNFKMAFYVVGFLIFVGALLGRLVCGFLCPFGLIQDLLNKIPFPKKIRTFCGDKLLRKLKYDHILEDNIIMHIIITASPKGIYKKYLKKAIIAKQYNITKALIKLKIFFK